MFALKRSSEETCSRSTQVRNTELLTLRKHQFLGQAKGKVGLGWIYSHERAATYRTCWIGRLALHVDAPKKDHLTASFFRRDPAVLTAVLMASQKAHMAHFLAPAFFFSFPRAFFIRFLVSFLARRPGPVFSPPKPVRFKRYLGSNFFSFSRFS